MTSMLRKIVAVMVGAGLLALAGPSYSQDWPSRSVTWLVPFAAGGPGDAVVRILAPRLGEVLGQTVIIENVGGAGGMTALNRIAKAPPDGYLFGTGNSGTHTFNQILTKAAPYNASADFAPVSMITDGGYVLVARKNLPVRTLPEFIDYARTNQAGMQYGSAGVGSGTHVVCALLNKTIGVDITHVPYRGTNLAMQDMIGGRIDYLCDAIATARPQIEGKTVNAIALLWLERSSGASRRANRGRAGPQGFQRVELERRVHAKRRPRSHRPAAQRGARHYPRHAGDAPAASATRPQPRPAAAPRPGISRQIRRRGNSEMDRDPKVHRHCCTKIGARLGRPMLISIRA